MAEDSVNFGPDDSIHIQTPTQHHFSNFNQYKSNVIKNMNQSVNYKYVNVLASRKSTNKFALNNQFEEFLNIDKSSSNIVTVSFLGPKKIGKSFLLDNILNLESGQIRRIMSRNNEQLVNSPTFSSYTNDNNRIIYFDNNGDPTPPLFLWLYFISSTMVYNLNPNSQNQQTTLFECILYVSNNLKTSLNQLSKPQLIIVRRDVGKKQMYDFELSKKIGQFQLFLPQIVILHMPYPGNKNVMTKQLIDVPQKELASSFLTQVGRLQRYLQMARPKQISDQTLNSQTFNLVIQSLTKSVNNQEQVSSKKIMEFMYETLSIGYYNNYLKCYSEELEKEFATQQPCDKYTMYKKLNNIKRRTNKKMERYSSFGNQPIFQKYKQKLDETIKSKEELVRGVNQAKSRQIHQKNCANLVQSLNQKNYEKLIDQYCKSKLDDQKIEVLLENYEKVLKPKQVQVPPANPVKVSKAVKPPPEIQNLDNQLKQLDQIITMKSKIPPPVKPNLDVVKSSIETKKAELMALKQQQERLANMNSPQFILSQGPKNEQIQQLESQRQRLKQTLSQLSQEIQNHQKQIENLRKANERKLKETTAKLQKEIAQQQQNLKKLKNISREQIVYKSKVREAGKTKKKTCCVIM